MRDTVGEEAAAFWRQHQEALSNNPSLLNKRGYWKGQAELLSSILDKFKDEGSLNPFERASLQVLKVTRDQFAKNASGRYTQRTARAASKLTTASLRTVGNFLNGFDKAFAASAAKAPWIFGLLLQALRIPFAVSAMLLRVTSQGLDWVIDKALPRHEAPKMPPAPSPQTGQSKQPNTVKSASNQPDNNHSQGNQQKEVPTQDNKQQPGLDQTVKPASPQQSVPPGAGPVQNLGDRKPPTLDLPINHRERVFVDQPGQRNYLRR